MANVRWRGDAPAVAQVVTATPANVEAGDVFTLTINGKAVSYAAAAPLAADVSAGLAAAVDASSIPEFQELVAEDAGTHVTLTARTPGVPFTIAASATNGGAANTQTLTLAAVTASAGPSHWNTAANWSGGAVPANGDDVFLEDSTSAIRFGLDQSAVTLASLHVAASFTGELGLARINAEGASEYAEYRPRNVAIGAAAIRIGGGLGDRSGRIQMDTGSAAAAITVHATGIALDDELPAFHWIGSHASNSLSVLSGTVGVALGGGEAAVLATLRQTGGEVRCGPGAAVADVERSGGGSLVLEAAAETLHQTGGDTLMIGAGGIDTLTLEGGRLDYRSSGTIGAATLDGFGATLDFAADLRARTVSACTLREGSILDPHRTVTWTSGIQPHGNVQAV